MRNRLALTFAIGLTVSACGGSTPPPNASPPAPEPVSPVAPPAAEPEPAEAHADGGAPEAAAEPAAEAKDAPSAGSKDSPAAGSKDSAAPASDEIKLVTTAGGRPMVQYADDKGVTTTLGANGGILKVGNATLRVPDGSLRDGMNVTFSIDAKTRGPAGSVGAVYKIGPQVRSSGAKFQIVLPVPAGAKSPSFALEVEQKDEKTGKAKTSWEVVAPTKIFTGNEPVVALLEVDALFDGHVTLTTAHPK